MQKNVSSCGITWPRGRLEGRLVVFRHPLEWSQSVLTQKEKQSSVGDVTGHPEESSKHKLPTAWIQSTQNYPGINSFCSQKLDSYGRTSSHHKDSMLEMSVCVRACACKVCRCVSLVPDQRVRDQHSSPLAGSRLSVKSLWRTKGGFHWVDRKSSCSPQGHYQAVIRNLPSNIIMVIIRYGKDGGREEWPKTKSTLCQWQPCINEMKRHSYYNGWRWRVCLSCQIREKRMPETGKRKSTFPSSCLEKLDRTEVCIVITKENCLSRSSAFPFKEVISPNSVGLDSQVSGSFSLGRSLLMEYSLPSSMLADCGAGEPRGSSQWLAAVI